VKRVSEVSKARAEEPIACKRNGMDAAQGRTENDAPFPAHY